MDKLRRRLFPVLLTLTVLAAIAVVVAFAMAFASLESGPNMTGYGYLETATRSVPFLAAAVVITVAARVELRRLRFAAGGLALASGVVAGAAAGLWTLGSRLAGFQPLDQPLDLTSLLLAVAGSGAVVAPAAVVLAVGAGLIAGAGTFARWIGLDFLDRAAGRYANPNNGGSTTTTTSTQAANTAR